MTMAFVKSSQIFILLATFTGNIVVALNYPPIVSFGPSVGVVIIPEDTPNGTTLLTISALDKDSDNLVFTMLGDTNKLVAFGPQNATLAGQPQARNVTLNSTLDKDRHPAQRVMMFVVRDDINPITGTVTLMISDVNDNPPVLTNLPYRLSIYENHTINTLVYNVTAEDVDEGGGGVIVYSMTPQAQDADALYNSTFVFLNANLSNIWLERQLDYETRTFYQYGVSVKDRGSPPCPGTSCKCNSISEPNVNCADEDVPFTVIVLDVQDTPPYFLNLPYIASVYENATIGTAIYQVSALDGDRGVPRPVGYSIVDGSNNSFAIDYSTGNLTVNAELDADNPATRNFELIILAQEIVKPGDVPGPINRTTKMSISVLDVNDNAPTFTLNLYTALIQENTPRGVPLTVKGAVIEVTDKDQSTNSDFNLTVEQDGAPYTAFDTLPVGEIHGTSAVYLRVFNSSVLDYEVTKNITLQIVARETKTPEGLSGNTTVIIFLEDMNDNSPVFSPNQSHEVNVTENSPNGTVLADFTATDIDSGQFGYVTYTLENDYGLSAIGPDNGSLTVINNIDREVTGDRIDLVVIATDNMAGDPSNRRSSRFNVRVTVLDENDNAPVFGYYPATVTVLENAPSNTNLLTLQAVDKDEGINAKVGYTVTDIVDTSSVHVYYLFAAEENTGILYVNSSLIDRSGSYNVSVTAFDFGSPSMSSTVVITVNILDVNSHSPVFTNPNQTLVNIAENIIPNVTINEEVPIGTFVILLQAEDDDSDKTNNGKVYFYIDPDTLGDGRYFTVNAVDGNLTVFNRLDRETHPNPYRINIRAQDNGLPPLSSVIPLNIILQDINDNDPYFDPRSLNLYVGEESNNALVGSVAVAKDNDLLPENKINCYYIYGGQFPNNFTLNKSTGSLVVIYKLDQDKTPTVTLYIKTTGDCSLSENYYLSNGGNNYNTSDNSLLNLLVSVVDINDNPPVFMQGSLAVAKQYDIPINTSVFELQAYTTDKDTLNNSRNMFRLLSTQFFDGVSNKSLNQSPPFTVTLNGSVLTNVLFPSNSIGFYTLTVQAYDDIGQNDTGYLKVYLISNAQLVRLVFNKDPNTVLSFSAEFISKLSNALNWEVIVNKITSHVDTDGKPDPTRTDMYIAARDRATGEFVPASSLWQQFDYNENLRSIFIDYGLIETSMVVSQQQTDTVNELEKPFIIIVVILAIVCIVLLVVLIDTIRRYRRRLRAATTIAYTSEKQQPDVFVPPGTNKYYAAENPIFGRDVKPVEVDRLSEASIDNNAVGGKEKDEEQEVYMQLYDEHNGPRPHLSHLDRVIKEFEKQTDDTASQANSSNEYHGKPANHLKSNHEIADTSYSGNVSDLPKTDI